MKLVYKLGLVYLNDFYSFLSCLWSLLGLFFLDFIITGLKMGFKKSQSQYIMSVKHEKCLQKFSRNIWTEETTLDM
jgi:hypothetical protein